MQLHISPNDPTPIYLQIVKQVKHLVAAGRLVPGEELPPIRTLAERLVVNPNTVARAYRELEAAGILSTRRTAGTYVAEGGVPRLEKQERLRLLTERVDALVVEARHMDIATEEVVDLVRARAVALRARDEEETEASHVG